MSKETLAPPLPPIDARTEAVAERLFGLKWALRKDSTEIIHEEWRTASEWIRDGYLRQAIEVLSAADQADGATASERGPARCASGRASAARSRAKRRGSARTAWVSQAGVMPWRQCSAPARTAAPRWCGSGRAAR